MESAVRLELRPEVESLDRVGPVEGSLRGGMVRQACHFGRLSAGSELDEDLAAKVLEKSVRLIIGRKR